MAGEVVNQREGPAIRAVEAQQAILDSLAAALEEACRLHQPVEAIGRLCLEHARR